VKQEAKKKQEYNVFLTSVYHGECGEIIENKQYLGKTWAVSEAQAENNVRFRYEGAKPAYTSYDTGRDTCIDYFYNAVLSADNR